MELVLKSKIKVLESIFLKIKEYNIPYDLNEKNNELILEGFSKSGTCVLKETESGQLIAYTRYDQEDIIESFADLVQLNYQWFNSYRFREPFTHPHRDWEQALIDYGHL